MNIRDQLEELQDRLDTTEEAFEQAEDAFAEIDSDLETLRECVEEMKTAMASGNREHAKDCFEEALKIIERMEVGNAIKAIEEATKSIKSCKEILE